MPGRTLFEAIYLTLAPDIVTLWKPVSHTSLRWQVASYSDSEAPLAPSARASATTAAALASSRGVAINAERPSERMPAFHRHVRKVCTCCAEAPPPQHQLSRFFMRANILRRPVE